MIVIERNVKHSSQVYFELNVEGIYTMSHKFKRDNRVRYDIFTHFCYFFVWGKFFTHYYYFVIAAAAAVETRKKEKKEA